jgi:hypothetical protein
MKSLAFGGLLALALAPDGDRTKAPEGRDLNRFIFFAVLEGLVAESVPDETVAKILEQKDGRYVHFVYACGICTPTIEALRAYAMRGQFYHARKGDPLAGKPALPADLQGLLDHPEAEKRREGIEKLVNRFIERRFEELRYTEAERTPMRSALLQERKRAAGMLARQPDLKDCPSCRGAAAGDLLR